MELFIIGALIVIGFLVLGFLLSRNQKKAEGDQSLVLLKNQISEITRMLDLRLGESAKIIRDVTDRLAKLDETNRQVVNFADQLERLQDILKNPKQRGVFGEYYLETLLKNAFQPKQYQMQYAFQDGEIVDAALFFGDKIIPIDSKFSLENYNRIVEERDPARREELEKTFKQDLKKRIDETAKYIRPGEGTTEFGGFINT